MADDDEYMARARELTSPAPDGIRVRLHPASCEASLRDLAAALRAERMRGRREGLERAIADVEESAAAWGDAHHTRRLEWHDAAGCISADLRAIDPESWQPSPNTRNRRDPLASMHTRMHTRVMTSALDILPAPVRRLVVAYMARTGRDYTSPAAMYSRCEMESIALAHALDGARVLDEDGDCIDTIAAYPRIAPVAELAGDEKADGHYVCRVTYDFESWDVDLTAAQFDVLGWTGPRVEAV